MILDFIKPLAKYLTVKLVIGAVPTFNTVPVMSTLAPAPPKLLNVNADNSASLEGCTPGMNL